MPVLNRIPPSINPDPILNKENSAFRLNYNSDKQQHEETLMNLNQKVDDIYQSLYACISNHCISKEDLQAVLDVKVGREELEEILV